MVRSAAKNWKDVAVLTDASQYASALAELQNTGAISLPTPFAGHQRIPLQRSL